MLSGKASSSMVGLALRGRDPTVYILNPPVIGYKIGRVAMKSGEWEEGSGIEARKGHRKFVGLVLLVMTTGIGI